MNYFKVDLYLRSKYFQVPFRSKNYVFNHTQARLMQSTTYSFYVLKSTMC